LDVPIEEVNPKKIPEPKLEIKGCYAKSTPTLHALHSNLYLVALQYFISFDEAHLVVVLKAAQVSAISYRRRKIFSLCISPVE